MAVKVPAPWHAVSTLAQFMRGRTIIDGTAAPQSRRFNSRHAEISAFQHRCRAQEATRPHSFAGRPDPNLVLKIAIEARIVTKEWGQGLMAEACAPSIHLIPNSLPQSMPIGSNLVAVSIRCSTLLCQAT